MRIDTRKKFKKGRDMVNEIFVLAADSTVFQVIGEVSKHLLKSESYFKYSNGPCVRLMSCRKTKVLYDGHNRINTVWHQHYGAEFGTDEHVELSLEGISFVSHLPKTGTDNTAPFKHPVVVVPIAGLFLCPWVALGMHLRRDLTPIDKIALPFTKEVMFRVGVNNPFFVLSQDLWKIVLSSE